MFHRFTIIRFSGYLLVLSIMLQALACGSGSGSAPAPAPVPAPGSGTGTEISEDSTQSTFPAITWVAPSEREDGTPILLSEIAGYRIYYGSKSGEYLNSVDILDNSAVDLDLSAVDLDLNEFLPGQGQYYLVITTLDTEGRESEFSEEVSVTW